MQTSTYGVDGLKYWQFVYNCKITCTNRLKNNGSQPYPVLETPAWLDMLFIATCTPSFRYWGSRWVWEFLFLSQFPGAPGSENIL